MYKFAMFFALIAFAPGLVRGQSSQRPTSPQQQEQTPDAQRDRDSAMQNQQQNASPNYSSSDDRGTQGLQPGYANESSRTGGRSHMATWVWAIIALAVVFAIIIPLTRRRHATSHHDNMNTPSGPRT